MSTPVEEFRDPLDGTAIMEDVVGQSMPSGGETSPRHVAVANETKPREKKRVGFTGSVDDVDRTPKVRSTTDQEPVSSGLNTSPKTGTPETSGNNTPLQLHSRRGSTEPMLTPQRSDLRLPDLSPLQTEQIHRAFNHRLQVPKPKPAIRPAGPNRSKSLDDTALLSPDPFGRRDSSSRSAQRAFERGKQLERDQQGSSTLRNNPIEQAGEHSKHVVVPTIRMDEVPGEDLDGSETPELDHEPKWTRQYINNEAFKLVRRHTEGRGTIGEEDMPGLRSGAVTPTEEREFVEDYQPPPAHFRGSILGALLKLNNQAPRMPSRRYSNDLPTYSDLSTPQFSPPESGSVTPIGGRPWYHRRGTHSSTSLAHLVGSSASLGSPVVSGLGEQVAQRLKEKQKRPRSSGAFKHWSRMSRSNFEDQIRITVHIAETIARQKYLIKLCRALMQYGAPTHRLEEYMRMSARVLETDAQFLYIPGAMIMSFDDAETHTTEVKLVKVDQALDLGKLRDVHEVYKEVVHDRIGVEEATQRLKEITARKVKYNVWVRIFFHGFATLCVGPWAFGAQLMDLPIAFFLGCVVGTLQLVVAPASDLYANVFEITAALITSFLARAFGSIRGGEYFCFSALAQSAIAMILPGWLVLCASLELQSRSIIAGSVRMVYAIMYTLFLGFGITIGVTIYGLIDKNATSATSCSNPIPEYWFFFFVPGFTVATIIINQGKWKQAPIMIFISFTGYLVNYFSGRRFLGNTQISNSLGALAVGVQANLYSRVGGRVENWFLDLWEDRLRPRWRAFRKKVFKLESRKHSPKVLENGEVKDDNESTFVRQTRRIGYSLAAAAMLPAIFVQVPSGLAISGSLVAGIASANQIVGNTTNGTQVVNITTISVPGTLDLNSSAFSVCYSVIQVAIGITVGLFLSAVVVYPFGKRRSGLFSL